MPEVGGLAGRAAGAAWADCGLPGGGGAGRGGGRLTPSPRGDLARIVDVRGEGLATLDLPQVGLQQRLRVGLAQPPQEQLIYLQAPIISLITSKGGL